MAREHKHGHTDDKEHEHAHGHSHAQGEHAHEHDHEHGHAHSHGHHDHSHGEHHHHDEHRTRFHDPQHAAEYDRRAATGGIRGDLTQKLIEMLALKGDELVLDLATGTGRVARPVAQRLRGGRVVGVDQALAMLDVGHQHEENAEAY